MMRWGGNSLRWTTLACAALAGFALPAYAQDAGGLETLQGWFLAGDYEACQVAAAAASPADPQYPAMAALELKALMEMGKYAEALKRCRVLWRRVPYDSEVALEVIRVLKANGETAQATEVTEQAIQFRPPPPIAGNSRSVVAFAELLLANRLDGKLVLERLLEPAKKADPEGRASYLALGRLALANHDRELAAENFREGLKRFPGDPEFAFGLQQSGLELARSEHAEGVESYLELALKANPKYIPALLYKADRLTGGKNFTGARETLHQVLGVNPDHPEAWAQLAALALVEDDAKAAETAVDRARKFNKDNARISEIIGVTLAGQYRFKEAIAHLERAIAEDPSSPSILFELGSNQLRFGHLEEGWKNIAMAHEMDPYNVAAFNLITLRDKISKYPVREKDGVLLRMSPQDMAVFGTRALELAARAKRTLADKYDIRLSQPVMVEMLPKQEDFAIRTFGLPGGEAFLGVCFGPLITMTSPRGRLGRANWEAVLWHEMAHTITLDASRHRIPRWLSEGISVFEEREVSTAWGQGMTSEYRERFLTEKLPPIIRLDESFAGPDIMFGYYHASLVVEYIVGKFGIQSMRAILADLSAGMPVNQALADHTLPIDELESKFLTYAKKQAAEYGPELDWTPLGDDEYVAYRKNPASWVAEHPRRYAAAMMRVSTLTEEGKWPESKAILEKIIAAEPNNREAFNPYRSLALACRGLGDETGERDALTKLLEIDSNHSEAAARLLEIGGSLPAEQRLAIGDRMLETNPFQEQAYRTLAAAAKESDAPERARDAYLSLLALQPRDAGRIHFELASQLRENAPNESRRQVLKALEENPRFEAALEFLISLPATR